MWECVCCVLLVCVLMKGVPSIAPHFLGTHGLSASAYTVSWWEVRAGPPAERMTGWLLTPWGHLAALPSLQTGYY